MIDLDETENAARKPWYCRSGQDENLLQPDTIVELITRLRQAEKDAARYRWLRDSSQVCIEEFANTFRRNRDSFVDEAMKCK